MKNYSNMTKNIYTFLLLSLIVLLNSQVPVSADSQPGSSSIPSYVYQTDPPVNYFQYLPLLNSSYKELPLMLGVYPNGYPGTNTIDSQLKPLDAWVSGVTKGRSTSIVGTFMDLKAGGNYKANVTVPLTQLWDAGYTTFINLPAPGGVTAEQMASGAYDPYIRQFAVAIKNFSNGGTRFVYIAPLQEMNGTGDKWVSYGGDPPNYIRTYIRFRTIFTAEGVPAQSVKWVFAPNGWTPDGLPLFEAYYPGDAVVDVVAFSAYNWGYCYGAKWEEPATVFNNPTFADGFYLDRMRAMAPTKPIFIAETASSSCYYTSGAKNNAMKDQWLQDAYQYLSMQPHVKAVLYLNFDKECDWPFYVPGKIAYYGYKTGVNSYGYSYVAPYKLMLINHSVH
jgi:hypothetical protein